MLLWAISFECIASNVSATQVKRKKNLDCQFKFKLLLLLLLQGALIGNNAKGGFAAVVIPCAPAGGQSSLGPLFFCFLITVFHLFLQLQLDVLLCQILTLGRRPTMRVFRFFARTSLRVAPRRRPRCHRFRSLLCNRFKFHCPST